MYVDYDGMQAGFEIFGDEDGGFDLVVRDRFVPIFFFNK